MTNVFLWPALMFSDGTSWIYYAPPPLAIAARVIIFVLIGVLWLRFVTGRETGLFWTLAMVNTLLLLTGGVFHNNYVPWASIWAIAAIVEAFDPNPLKRVSLDNREAVHLRHRQPRRQRRLRLR